ncbi:MAG TPA: MBL fold metallo-hydrolase [Bdellovibrionota bacterium]|nr:MBL fold metallo-hydrolase [Bdellovibrionota bacterium]
MTEPALYFKQLEIGPMANFIYLIGDPASRVAAVVDPAWDVDRIVQTAEKDGYSIGHVLVTHGHPDHINGVEELLNRTDAQLHMHKSETPWMKGWKATATPRSHGDELKIGNLVLTFVHTPGHTPGSQCFLVQNRLVSGDTLFINSCGRTDLPGGDPEQLYDSLAHRLSKLDDNVVLFPGHNYAGQPTSTMGEQKRHNPFLRSASLNDFLAMVRPKFSL